jgi:hypothetical protein
LEAFVHLPQELRDELPDMEAVRLDVPDDAGASDVSRTQLERLMAAPDPLGACQAVGDRWLSAGADLVFKAPSVLIPEETNVMLNPLHPDMRRVRIVSTRPFRFDPRLTRPA